MNAMFAGMTNLQELNLSSFDTSNVTNVASMFGGLSSLKTLNLSNWDLSSISSPPNIFNSSSNNNLNTINMTNAIFPINSGSFFGSVGPSSCPAKEIILANVDTSHVTDMHQMFNFCSNLTELDLSSFDTSNVANMESMFNGATSLQSITFGSKFVHNPEATTSRMFYNCPLQDRPTGDTWTDVSFD